MTEPLKGLTEPRVVAVVVNYRTPDDTIRCVGSLLELAYGNLSVTVVDNGSNDGSVEKIAQALEGTRLLPQETNTGYCGGNNAGVADALERGADYVLVVNPDTEVVDRHFLRRLATYMEREPSVGAVGPRVHWRFPGVYQNTVLRFPWIWRRVRSWLSPAARQPAMARAPIDVDALNGVCVLFRAACLRDVGAFDERTFAYIEDIDWGYRARRRGWRRVYLPVDSVVHRPRGEGYEMGGPVDYLLKRNTLYFLLRTGHRVQAAAYTFAIGALTAARAIRGRANARWGRWSRALGRAAFDLWTGHWDRAMGRPPAL